MQAIPEFRAALVIAVLAAVSVPMDGCHLGAQCTPSAQRTCSLALEGGIAQGGYQVCDSDGQWSECLSVGACAAGSSQLPAYARCSAQSQCGPTSCSTCSPNDGVLNPNAYSLCQPFCQQDADCAPVTPSVATTPRCVLGLCALFCTTASTCPNDTQCLAFMNPDAGALYPGFTGLCE